jgi:hypothetical protein
VRPTFPSSHKPLGVIGERRLGVSRLLIPAVLLLAFFAWPYVTLWRLDRALTRDEPQALAALVDLAAVREEIQHRLNKENASTIGPVSDDFVAWLERAIRRNGTDAIEHQVDLEWVRGRLLSRSPPGEGLRSALTRAFFDDPLHFSLRMGAPSASPVYARLSLQRSGWRLTALYF